MPALVGGVIAIRALGGFFATRAAAGSPSDDEAQAVASSAVALVSARLDADGRLLGAASEAIEGNATLADQQLLHGLTRVAQPGRIIGVARTTSATTARVAVAPGA